MTSKWLGPNEKWPEHSRPLARDAVARAKRSGWWLRPASHAFGRLRCAHPEDLPSGACAVTILSTSGPADGSATAREILKVLDACPHRTSERGAPDAEDAARQARQLLAQLQRIASAADRLLAWSVERKRADTAFAEALQFDRDDRLVHAAEHDEAAAAAASSAFEDAVAGRVSDPWPPERGAAELVERLAEGLERAEALLEGQPATEMEKALGPLRAGLESLKQRLHTTE